MCLCLCADTLNDRTMLGVGTISLCCVGNGIGVTLPWREADANVYASMGACVWVLVYVTCLPFSRMLDGSDCDLTAAAVRVCILRLCRAVRNLPICTQTCLAQQLRHRTYLALEDASLCI